MGQLTCQIDQLTMNQPVLVGDRQLVELRRPTKNQKDGGQIQHPDILNCHFNTNQRRKC